MSSVEEIEKANKQSLKQLRLLWFRSFVSIILGALLLVVLSPKNNTEYLSSILFIIPFFLWTFRTPKNQKFRTLTSLFLYIISGVIYLCCIQNT